MRDACQGLLGRRSGEKAVAPSGNGAAPRLAGATAAAAFNRSGSAPRGGSNCDVARTICGAPVRRLTAFSSTSLRWLASLSLAACASGPPPAPSAPPPPETPPSPESVTQKEPGGDAKNPHRAALERLLASPWGARSDKGEQILAPLPDWENWKRVRFWGFEHVAGFRYGQDYHAVGVARVQELPAGVPARSSTCLNAAEAWVRPQLQGFDVKLGAIEPKLMRWHDQVLEVHTMDGWVGWGVGSADFSAAWTAYPAYPGACLVYGIAVPWRGQKDVAMHVRDRFVSEGFLLLQALTEDKPKPWQPPGEAPSAAAPPPR